MILEKIYALYGMGEIETFGHKATFGDHPKNDRCASCAGERRNCYRFEPDMFYKGSACPQFRLDGAECSFVNVEDYGY